MNILPLLMQYFGPVIMNKLAGSLGINSTLAQRAIALAAPAILAGLIGKTQQPGGAKILSDMIAKQDPGLLGRLGEMIGTGQQASVVEQGTSALGNLLGNTVLGSLAGALSKQVGLGAGASNTLLGLMAPAVLGTIGKEQKSAGLDAAGLANMLMSQKQSIADAIPSDFAKLLAGTGLLDAVQGKTSAASASASSGATVATPMPRSSTASMPKSSPSIPGNKSYPAQHHHFNWGPWLFAIAASSVVWWGIFGHKAFEPHPTVMIPDVVPPSTTLATGPALPEVIAKTDVGKLIVNILEETKGSISGVRDAATAQAALPRIQDVSSRLEKLNTQAAALNPDARRALATWVTSQHGLIRTAITNTLGIPGVSALLKPVLEQVLARIDSLAKA